MGEILLGLPTCFFGGLLEGILFGLGEIILGLPSSLPTCCFFRSLLLGSGGDHPRPSFLLLCRHPFVSVEDSPRPSFLLLWGSPFGSLEDHRRPCTQKPV